MGRLKPNKYKKEKKKASLLSVKEGGLMEKVPQGKGTSG